MKSIFQAIKAQLDTVSSLQHVGLDKGQFPEEKTNGAGLNYPCVLINLELPTCEDLNEDRSVQACDLLVTVRLAFDFSDSVDNDTPAKAEQQTLDYLDTLKEVHEAVQGFSTPEFVGLSRVSLINEYREDMVKIISLKYSSRYEDTVGA